MPYQTPLMLAIGYEMAELRNAAKLTVREAAEITALCTATITRTETGERIATVSDLSAQLTAYRADKATRERIMKMAAELHRLAWVESGSTLPRLRTPLHQFESDAASIVDFAAIFIPGVLQTRAYAQAIFDTTNHRTTQEKQEALEARMKRKKVLTKLARPSYHAILDEATLRRPYGGSAIMAQQIRTLIKHAKEGNAVLRIIPYRAGGYPNMGTFKLMEFRRKPPMVYASSPSMAGFMAPNDVDGFQDATNELPKFALSPTDTLEFLTMVAKDHERA